MPETITRNAPPGARAATPVLVVGGRASALRMLDLARWAGAGASSLHVLIPGEYDAVHGDEAIGRLLSGAEPGDWPLQSARLLDAIESTGVRSVVLGYPADAAGRSDFSLAVQRVRAEVDVDMIVYLERHQRPWRRILVPYLSSALDGAALRLAAASPLDVTLLHTVEPFSEREATVMRQAVDDARCTLRVVETTDPLATTAQEAAEGYELVMLGGGGAPRGRAFTMRQQRMLLSTDTSLVVVHSAA